MGRLILLAGLLPALFLGFVAPALAASPESSLLERKCTDCHDLDVIIEKEAYMADWREVVDRMAAYDGSEITRIDKLMALKYIKDNLALDGPGGKAKSGKEK